MFRFWHHWFIVWEALIRRDVARATTYQPEMLRLALEAGRALDEAVAQLLSAQVLHARGAESAARKHLDRGFEIGRLMSSAYVEFMARLTEAQLCLDCGRESDGLQGLRIARARGGPRPGLRARPRPEARARAGEPAGGGGGVALAHQDPHARALRGAAQRRAGEVRPQGPAPAVGPAESADHLRAPWRARGTRDGCAVARRGRRRGPRGAGKRAAPAAWPLGS